MSEDEVLAEYRASASYRWMLLVALLVAISLLAWIWTAASSTGAAVFGCLLASIPLGWLVYGFGFRIADRVELSASELAWRSPLWRGRVPLSRVRSMADALPVVDALRISVQDAKPVYVRVGGGISQFMSRTERAAPHVRVTLSRRLDRVQSMGEDGYSDGA